jgi:hypothetical protein
MVNNKKNIIPDPTGEKDPLLKGFLLLEDKNICGILHVIFEHLKTLKKFTYNGIMHGIATYVTLGLI